MTIERAHETIREELLALQQRVKSGIEATLTMTDPPRETLRLDGNEVVLDVVWKSGRGAMTLYSAWYLNGRRLGFNALIGALREKGIE